jgi:hypothetical protein
VSRLVYNVEESEAVGVQRIRLRECYSVKRGGRREFRFGWRREVLLRFDW